MRLIAKAALGALAIASLGFGVSAPANAARIIVTTPGVVTTTPNVVVTNPCLRAPEFRPGYCFRGDRFAFLDRDRLDRMREHMWRDHERRQAFLDRHVDRDMYRDYGY